MLKNWLTIGSISFGVSFVCALPFTQNLARAAFIGLATIPGVFAGATVKSRQRQRHTNRQLTAEISRLQGLRQQSATIDRQLQITIEDRRSIEARVRQLNTLVTNLNARIDRDTQYQSQLEQNLAAIVTHCEEREEIAARLNSKISEKQARLLEIDGQLSESRLQLTIADSELNKKQARAEYLGSQLISKINEIATSDRRLQVIRSEVNALHPELANLKFQFHSHHNELDDCELVELKTQLNSVESQCKDKQIQLGYLDAQLFAKNNEVLASDRDLQLTRSQIINCQTELANLDAQLEAKIMAANQIDIDSLTEKLDAIESECSDKQIQLEDLKSQLAAKNTEIESRNLYLQLTQSEVSNHQAELAALEVQLQAKIIEASQIDIDSLRSELNSIELERSEKQTQLENLESQLVTKNIEIASSDRQFQLTQLATIEHQLELAKLESQLQDKIEEAGQIDIVSLRSQLNSIELQSREKQAKLVDLEAKLVASNNEILASNQSLELTQLELVDRRSELAELEAKIYAKLEEMDEVELDLKIALQRIEPQPPQTSRSLENLNLLDRGEWHHNFTDNPHLEILQHIEKHGAIAEAEVNHKLGNPRSVRQFANKLEEYTQYLPFTIRVESSPQGNRYLRDSQN